MFTQAQIEEITEKLKTVHLDINTDPQYGSNCAALVTAVYVLGMTGIDPKRIKLKPESWAASFGADHIANKG